MIRNLKLILLLVIMLLSLQSCKKDHGLASNDLSHSELQNEVHQKKLVGNEDIGACALSMADDVRTWIGKYGAGGAYFWDRTSAVADLNDIIEGGFDCAGAIPPSSPGPALDEFLLVPELVESNDDIYDFLNLVGITDLCDNTQVSTAYGKIQALNAIVKRAADLHGSSYYSASNAGRLYMVINSFYASESSLMNWFGLRYLTLITQLGYAYPDVIAQLLLDKPEIYSPAPNPVLLQPSEWGGFNIDYTPSANILNDYCATPPAPLIMPPLLLVIRIPYHDTELKMYQDIPWIYTDIYFNSGDSKYYEDALFTTYVPDGYYKHPDNYTNDIYYRVVSGVVTEILHAEPGP